MAQMSRYLKMGELLAILNDLWRGRDTGTLVLQKEAITKFLYFQDGQVIFAASNAPEDKFTQILIDQGRLTADQVNLATQKRESRTLGRTLVDLGFIGSEDLLDALIAQVRKIALSVAEWTSGSSSFKPNVLPPGVAKLPITTERLVVDTALGMQDRAWVGQTLGGLETVLKISTSEKGAVREMPMSADETRLLDVVDGKRSIREICEESGMDVFTGARFLLGLFHLQYAHRKEVLMPRAHGDEAKVDLSFLDDVVPPPASGKTASPPPPPPPPPPPSPHKESPELPFVAPPAAASPSPPPPPQPEEPPELPLAAPAPPPPAESPFTFLPPPESLPEPEIFGEATPAEEDAPYSGQDVIAAAESPPDRAEEGAGDLLVHPIADFSGPLPNRKKSRTPLAVSIVTVALLCAISLVWWFRFRPPSEPPAPAPPKAGARKAKPAATAAEKRQEGNAVPSTPPAGAPAAGPAAGNAAAPPPAPGPIGAQIPAPKAGPAVPQNAPSQAVLTPQPQAPPNVKNTPTAASRTAPPPVPPAAKTLPPPSAKPASAAGPSTPPAGKPRDLLRAGRYAEAAKAFEGELRGSKAAYTIDVEIACQPDTIGKGLAAAQGDTAYMILPYDFRGRSCYRVLWGTYKSRAEAEAALKKLPSNFLADASPPKVRPWGDVMPGK